jgi:hypothetical protein
MLGLKLRSQCGRTAGVWSLSAVALALSACSTSTLRPTPKGDVSFLGASELTPILATDERLLGCVTQKMLTYAVGRGFSNDDAASIKSVTGASQAAGKGFRSLFANVATSEAFRSRRAVGP